MYLFLSVIMLKHIHETLVVNWKTEVYIKFKIKDIQMLNTLLSPSKKKFFLFSNENKKKSKRGANGFVQQY